MLSPSLKSYNTAGIIYVSSKLCNIQPTLYTLLSFCIVFLLSFLHCDDLALYFCRCYTREQWESFSLYFIMTIKICTALEKSNNSTFAYFLLARLRHNHDHSRQVWPCTTAHLFTQYLTRCFNEDQWFFLKHSISPVFHSLQKKHH